MLALGKPDEDFDVGLLEGRAELLDASSAELLPAGHLTKYRAPMAAIGLTPDEFLATYTQVIRIVPTRYLPWHGRTEPATASAVQSLDRRLAAAIRRVAATVAASTATPLPVGRVRLTRRVAGCPAPQSASPADLSCPRDVAASRRRGSRGPRSGPAAR